MTDVPPAATTAAADAIHQMHCAAPNCGHPRTHDLRLANAALAAALPHLTPPPPDSEAAVTVAAWTWDWREQPPLEDIAENIGARTSLHVYLPETGSDQYALVIASRVLSDSEVGEAWNR